MVPRASITKLLRSTGQASKTEVLEGPTPSMIFQEPSLDSPELTWLSGTLWYFLAGTHITPTSVFSVLCRLPWLQVSFFLERHRSHIGIGALPSPVWSHFNLTNYLCSVNWVTIQVLWLRTSAHLFFGGIGFITSGNNEAGRVHGEGGGRVEIISEVMGKVMFERRRLE